MENNKKTIFENFVKNQNYAEAASVILGEKGAENDLSGTNTYGLISSMTIENLTKQWDKSFEKSKKEIKAFITPRFNQSQEESNFITLALWLLENPYNPAEYLSSFHYNFRSNPFETNSFLSELNHALIDDGNVSFVKMFVKNELKRIFIIFKEDDDLYSKTNSFMNACKEENKSFINSTIDMNAALMNALKKNDYISINDFTFESHNEPLKFINDFENFQLKEKELNEKRKQNINKALKIK